MFAEFKKCRTFASLLKRKSTGVKLSWFRASALQAEGRRFESVNAHYKTESYEEIREAFFISYRFYTNFLYPFAL